MDSYFEVCHGHPVQGHLYVPNMEKAGVQKKLDPTFGFTLTSDPNTASLMCGGR